jgi:hypothetical protein
MTRMVAWLPRAATRRVVWNFAFLFSILLIACSGSRASLGQATISIFGNAVPVNAAQADSNAVTLGVKFWSAQPGAVSGIRFYRGHTNQSGYTVRLYTGAGSLLAQATTAHDTCTVPCWEQVNFTAPISISAKTTYVAAYYTSNGYYADGYYGLTKGTTNGPLVVPASGVSGGNGIYVYAKGFPNSTWEDSNYYVDVAFTVSAPSLLLSFNPMNPSLPDNSPIGTPIATAVATWSDGSQFTGTYALVNNDNGLCAISGNKITLGAALPSNHATQNCIVSATQ